MMNIRNAGLFAAGVSLVIGSSAAAQDRLPADARWLAWIDCWQPVAAPTSTVSMIGQAPTLCVVPAAGTSAAELVSIVDGSVVSRERIDAADAQAPLSAEGCAGWKGAKWSEDGARLYLRSESTCEGGLKRSSTGMLAMVSPTEWVDVQSITVGDRTAVRALRYVQAPNTVAVPAEIADAVRSRRLASGAARVASAGDIGHAEIIDAARHVNAEVVEAWLLERMPSLTVNARELVRLADAGVPSSVIDLVVALANQDRFSINTADRVAMAIPDSTVVRGSSLYYDPYGGSYWGYSRYSRYGMYGYSPYGYYPWGYGRYYASRPVVVVTPPTTPEDPVRTRGRAVNGRGYTRSGSSTSRDNPSTRSGGSSSGSGKSSGASSSGGSSSSGGKSSSGGRTAKQRPPG